MLRKSMSRVIACALAVAAVGVATTSVALAQQREDGHHAKHDRHGDRGRHSDEHGRGDGRDRSGIPFGPGYAVTPLVSDTGGGAVKLDPRLINGWGISAGPATPDPGDSRHARCPARTCHPPTRVLRHTPEVRRRQAAPAGELPDRKVRQEVARASASASSSPA